MVVATPSGLTLAPEGGAHQSILTPLIGIGQDGLAAFEPAFVDELAVIMHWGFGHMQREGDGRPDPITCLPDHLGGSIYLRLSTRPIEQASREMTPALEADVISGGYWLRRPGPNAQVVIAYTGAVAPEAIRATGLMSEDRRDVGLLAITSPDRLHAGWSAAERARQDGRLDARSHVERLLAPLSRDCGIVTVVDGHPATLAWLGSVHGHRLKALGVEKFGQTGSIQDLYRYYGLDSEAIMRAAESVSPGRPLRFLRAFPTTMSA
jgi:pyruvate dehydrogenase E1 component